LNELEEVQAEIKGELVEKTKTKRKKDGAAIIPRGANAIPIWGPDQVGKPTTQYILRIIQYGKTE